MKFTRNRAFFFKGTTFGYTVILIKCYNWKEVKYNIIYPFQPLKANQTQAATRFKTLPTGEGKDW